MSQPLHELNRNRTIPLFNCDYQSFDEHLEFYTALGFTIIYYQKAPYRYASVVKEGLGEFGFYGSRTFKEDGGVGGCFICVPDVRTVYAELKANLKNYYGKIPVKGMPRFSRLNQTAEDWRFNITDVVGNTIIIGEAFGDSTELMEAEEQRVRRLTSKFEKAYAQAYRFAYSKEDFLAARFTLEAAFRNLKEEVPGEMMFKAMVLQADVLETLGQREGALEALREAERIVLSVEERERAADAAGRLEELRGEIDF